MTCKHKFVSVLPASIAMVANWATSGVVGSPGVIQCQKCAKLFALDVKRDEFFPIKVNETSVVKRKLPFSRVRA